MLWATSFASLPWGPRLAVWLAGRSAAFAFDAAAGVAALCIRLHCIIPAGGDRWICSRRFPVRLLLELVAQPVIGGAQLGGDFQPVAVTPAHCFYRPEGVTGAVVKAGIEHRQQREGLGVVARVGHVNLL